MAILRRIPILAAGLAQILAAAVGLVVTVSLAGTMDAGLLRGLALVLQCGVAFALTLLFRLPRWWLWIAVLFPLALQIGLSLDNLPAWPFGVAFVALALVFSNTARERVPLYLTNRATAEALAALMTEKTATRVIDLGSGLGGVVRALDGDGRVARGVETAPLSWLVSWCLSKVSGHGTILRQDLWATDLSQEDVVYAFLSPEPMPELWEKARREMKAGSHLVSNSFAVPGVEPDEVWELSDRRRTHLFIYAIKNDRTV
ncbi:hypothetical protein ACQKGC_07525 [Allorhizobium pseudoryzae]|uniref:hypothetical protein n=1 Tax=Allorhizobium pseudoryzae TaxID=379684 RepID=UPI003D055765